MDLQYLKKFIQFETYGWIATSGLFLCVISGILLVVPYDFNQSYRSVSELLLVNQSGKLIRNFHYWSAQLFFIFTLLHIYDHLRKSTEAKIKTNRTWIVLCLATLFLGYEMISGFILKGDASGVQAHRIIGSLLESLPIAGKMLRSVFLGTGDNWQPIYIQHVSIGTIIFFIALYDHARAIWPKLKSLLGVFTIILIVSFFLRAPIGQSTSSQIKGPWFFVGIQEILHLTNHKVLIVWAALIFFVLFYLLPSLKQAYKAWMKRILLVSSIIYLALSITVLLFRGENWQWQGWKEALSTGKELLVIDPVNLFAENDTLNVPKNQKIEGCLVCHKSVKGLTESHNPSVIGCSSCHLGDPWTLNKRIAHKSIILVPGNFSNVQQTCGTQDCHFEISKRIMNSLMTTQSGIIGVDKFVFQETNSLNDTFRVDQLGYSAADTHLRNLCAGCHLGKEKTGQGNPQWHQRGGGCNACHLFYGEEANKSLERMKSKLNPLIREIHPSIDLQVTNDRCISCHSRSGRISLSYEGWNETTLDPKEVKDSGKFRILPDNRVLEYIAPDVHHEKGLACIDCHTSYEIMGTGAHIAHKEDAVKIGCSDCHPDKKINSMAVPDLPDYESQMIYSLRNFDRKNRVILTKNSNQPILNTRVDSTGQIILTGKLTGKSHLSKLAGQSCKKGASHNRLSCESCHTKWVPQCIGCHNVYEKGTAGFDLLTDKAIKGTWVEFAGKTFPEPPVMGISTRTGEQVVGALPGMIMSIDRKSFGLKSSESFHRLFAPAPGHTTIKEGRTCKSCHNNPLALGFGRGKLDYQVEGGKGKWIFDPQFEKNRADSLPEDAWTGFLQERKNLAATRYTLRPFNVAEQKRILNVGACLTCHKEKSRVVEQMLENFRNTLNKLSGKCILPSYP